MKYQTQLRIKQASKSRNKKKKIIKQAKGWAGGLSLYLKQGLFLSFHITIIETGLI